MRILPHSAAESHIAADLARLCFIIATTLKAPVSFDRWDEAGIPVFKVPADAAAAARALGLRVEVE